MLKQLTFRITAAFDNHAFYPKYISNQINYLSINKSAVIKTAILTSR